MTRSEMVTRSHPTHLGPNGGCLLLGNNRGEASSFPRETSQEWASLQNRGNLVLVPEEGGLGSRGQVLLVSPEEVGLSIGHPEESGINLVSRQSSAQLLNVLGVARLQGSFIKHPVLVSWGGDRRLWVPLGF